MGKRLFAFALSHLLVLGIGAFLALQAIQWFHPSPTGTLIPVRQKPYVAPQSPVLKKVPTGVVQPKIVVPKPTSRDVARIEKKIGGSLPPGRLLTVVETQKLCEGANIVVSLQPLDNGINEGPLQTVVTVYPKKRPFFEWRLERSLGVYAGLASGAITGQAFNAEFEQSLFRVGPAIVSVKAGAFVAGFGHFEYAMVGAKVTF